jgi:hypothetical protein
MCTVNVFHCSTKARSVPRYVFCSIQQRKRFPYLPERKVRVSRGRIEWGGGGGAKNIPSAG